MSVNSTAKLRDVEPVSPAAPPLQEVTSRDRANPNYWDALYLDQSIPVDPVAKAYMIKDLRNWTRHYFLAPVRLTCNLFLASILTLKRLVPLPVSFYGAMHRVIHFLLRTFVTPEANWILIRHFNLESNIVNFVLDNSPDRTYPRAELYPRNLDDIVDNAFNQHDWNLYNCILDYAEAKARHPGWLSDRTRRVRYDALRPVQVEIDTSRRGPLQLLDLETAFELFKFIYPPFLTNEEIDRAVLSLQFDENLFAYVAEITGDGTWRYLATNRQPLTPTSYFGGARHLFEHFTATEYLHELLVRRQREAAGA